MKDNEIFVFLSHSHKDYEKVRVVRDLLENEGFRPLMFFLKCLEKEEYCELTKTLIKEEIESRQRFILCESKNAKSSNWVQFEVEHIKEINRPYEVVNLDWPTERIEESIQRFKIRSTVFLSYPQSLRPLAESVHKKLKMHDFKTFFSDYLTSIGNINKSFVETIVDNLDEACKKGYVLVFIDDRSPNSMYQMEELHYAVDHAARNKNIIPITTVPLTDHGPIEFILADLDIINVQNMSISEASEHIVNQLMSIDSKKNQ